MKQCTKCKKWKDVGKFSKQKFVGKKPKNDGLKNVCKKCQKLTRIKHYEANKEKELYQNRKYKENNKEEIKLYNHQYKRNNKNKVKRYTRKQANSPLNFNSQSRYRKEIELYEEVKKSQNNNLECKCSYCGNWFEPVKKQLVSRIDAVNGKSGNGGSECRLYCSDKCKENCPIYQQKRYEKGYKPATSREVQPELRQLVFQRDNYTCQKCGYHKDELEVGIHCHHLEGIRWNPLESADEDACTTFCEKCHRKIHSKIGCRYQELQCT